MPVYPNAKALTAVNEALSALDYDSPEEHQADPYFAEAREMLLAARATLTDKPWPALRHPALNRVAFEAWHLNRAAEQRRDGRQ